MCRQSIKMKFVVLFVCALIALSHQEDFSEVKDVYESIIAPLKRTCINESNVSVELVDKLISEGGYVDDRPLKCYLRCFYLRLKILNEAGEVDEKQMKANAGVPDADIQEKVYQKCKDVTGADLCEKAFNISKCTYTTVKEITSKKA